LTFEIGDLLFDILIADDPPIINQRKSEHELNEQMRNVQSQMSNELALIA
jgi:hypothetical protein